MTVSVTPATINENGSTTLSGTFTDPGTLDVHTVVIDWGDGTADTTLTLAPNVLTFSATHQYLDDGSSPGNGTASDVHSISVTVTDDDTGVGTAGTTVTVNNVAPAAVTLSTSPTTFNENGTTTLSGTFTDPGTLDAHTVVIKWGAGSADTTLSLAANVLTFSTTHQYLDDGVSPGNGTASDAYTINVTVTDDDTGVGTGSTTVTVNNVAPVITGITPPALPIEAGHSTGVSVNFTDIGSLDGHTCTFAWGDSTPSTTVTAAGTGNGSCSDTHTYAAPGLYTVTATVKDDDTGAATTTTQILVFAYANGGSFVVGDKTATGQVLYWGAQWANTNVLSGGAAPDAFKGFASGGKPNCGTGWITRPGNSPPPPSTVPTYMAVVVSTSITKSGADISGDTVKIVIVKTDPGYDGNPGHAGKGTVVATLCGG